jgi:hypothetical protein
MSDKKHPDKGYRVIRLVNGEKLIAKICGSTKHKLVLHRPMTIRGMTTNNPLKGITKEYLILNDWLEHCKDNEVGIRLESILTISNPDDHIIDAYDCQKEYMDTGMIDPRMEDVPSPNSGDQFTIAELLSELGDEDQPSSGQSLKEWVESFVSSIIENAANNLEEDWDEEDIDTDRPDWGNDFDDWSPYPEDYM